MNPLIVIPCRGTSKGIPRKNFKPFCGKPLIEWTLDVAEALGVPYVITTDQEGMVFLEPSLTDRSPAEVHVSTRHGDTTPMIDIVQEMTERVPGDPIILLQPTSPCRFPEDVRLAYEQLQDNSAVCAVRQVPRTSSPGYTCTLDDMGYLQTPPATRRQQVVPVYTRSGEFYITRRNTIYDNSFYGESCVPYLLFGPEVKLDEPDDWALGELLASIIDPMRFG